MKKILFITVIALSIFSCKNKGEKSDAFGNFETDDVIVSAETAGKILKFNASKGQITTKTTKNVKYSFLINFQCMDN